MSAEQQEKRQEMSLQVGVYCVYAHLDTHQLRAIVQNLTKF